MTDGIVPITIDERRARIEKARRLMAENRIDAILLEGGSSMFYFTGVRWGLSERPFVAVIPAKGELAWVCPGFEEARARELIKFGDRRPHLAGGREPVPARSRRSSRIAASPPAASASRSGCASSSFNGVRKEAPALDYVSADPVTAGCRMIKSPAEIALMQRANDMTIAAYKAGARDAARGDDAGRPARTTSSPPTARIGAPSARRRRQLRRSTPRSRTAASRRSS